MLIPERDLQVLKKHAAKLVAASESLETWQRSSYGTFIEFVNRCTLGNLRKCWTRYQNSPTSGDAAAAIRSELSQRSKEIKNSNVLTGVRSAGPLWTDGLQLVGHVFRSYWETGIAGGCSEDCKKLGKGSANPMFTTSSAPSGKFAVHYGTEPLLGFHLAECFRSLRSNQSLTLAAQGDQLVKAAKHEFHEWCSSYATAHGQGRVHIQLLFGEAITFCHELQLELALGQQSHARAYTRPWSLQPLHMDGFAGPRESRRSFLDYFDVVDTSNLGDHVGLINIITATAPLLRPLPSSTLYTESLLVVSNTVTTALSAALGCDVPTFSFLTGLAPSGLSGDSTLEAVSNEAVMQTLAGHNPLDVRQRQYRLRVHWRTPDTPMRITVDPDGLATFFLETYKKMFSQEDLSTLFSRMDRMQTKPYSTDMQRYTRAAIVALLRLVKSKVCTDWDRAIDEFHKLVETDRSLLVGSNSLQELNMHLALLGVWTLPILAKGPREVQEQFNLSLRPRTADKGILGDINPPPFVHLIISVPRKQLKVFTDTEHKSMSTPGMHVSVKQRLGVNMYENCFYSFHCYFGRFLEDKSIVGTHVFEEDEKGWLGAADLVVICAVPTFGLLMGPKAGIDVSLVLNTNPENLMLFGQKLGPLLTIFETSLGDRRSAVQQDPPHIVTRLSTIAQQKWMETVSRNSALETASAIFDTEHRIRKFQIRNVFSQGSAESSDLASGATVTIDPVDLYRINLKVGAAFTRRTCFPFPVQTYNTKTRVARKSSWVEVEAAIYVAPEKDPFDTWTEVRSSPDHTLALGYIPYVNLDIQPVITRLTKQDSVWLNMLTAGTLSSAEQDIQRRNDPFSTSPKSDLKQSLNIMFQSFAGYHPKAQGEVRTFQLTLQRNQSSDTIIFVHNMRHDLDLGSIVLDAYVMPLTDARVQNLSRALERLLSAKGKAPLGLYVTDEESILWKRLMPGLAERCRTWQHTEKCEYRTTGKIPLAIEADKNPLCSCGEGKVPTNFTAYAKEWAPFEKYVTRIAIPLVFPVPYVEPLAKLPEMGAQAAQTTGQGPQCDNCNKSSTDLKACGGCGKAHYCSKDCQKVAWKAHKLRCKD